jgi:hypothetical protein
LVSTTVLFWVFFLLPSASHDPAKPFFCFLHISLYLRFLLGRSKVEKYQFYIRNQSVPRCKHFPLRL